MDLLFPQTFFFPEKTNQEVAEIHLITGQNGTGKSTLLSIIAGLLNGLDQKRVRKDCVNNIEIIFQPFESENSDKNKAEFKKN